MHAAEPISKTVRRRFVLGKQGLWPGRRRLGNEGPSAALHAVEAVQVDPVSVVASSAGIVLSGRIAASVDTTALRAAANDHV